MEQLAEFLSAAGPALSQMSPEQLLSNHIFTAFLGLAVLGILSVFIRNSSSAGYGLVRKLMFDEVNLDSEYTALYYLDMWISRNKNLSKKRNVNIVSSGGRYLGYELGDNYEDAKGSTTNYGMYYSLGEGIHFMIIKKHFCVIQRSIERTKSGKVLDRSLIRIFGANSKRVIMDCILEEINREKVNNLLRVYEMDDGLVGQASKFQKRSLDTITTNDGIKEYLDKDMTTFDKKEEWYVSKGIPYRRGYLLYGPPGTGKSSLIKSLVAKHSDDLYMINLANILNDKALADSFRSAANMASPGKITYIVLEDVDCVSASKSRENSDSESPHKYDVTLQGLLNVLDGISSSEGVVVFMTTNYVDRLDPALIRHGRVDVKLEILPLATDGIKDYLKNYFEVEDIPFKLSSDIQITGAELQNICMTSDTLDVAISKLRAGNK